MENFLHDSKASGGPPPATLAEHLKCWRLKNVLKGVKVTDAQLAAVNLTPHKFHGDWNYTISPKKKSARQRSID